LTHNIFADKIENFKVYTGIAEMKNNKVKYIILRSFKASGKENLLVVNPKTLRSVILKREDSVIKELSFENALKYYSGSTYAKIIKNISDDKEKNRNAGIKHIKNSKSVYLTIDLCPSKRPMDKIIFEKLIENQGAGKKIPLSISISGLWMKNHSSELEYIKIAAAKNDLNILWINHTLTHSYDREAQDEKNFLLLPGENPDNEILENEKLMLEHDVTPSVFLRFPGLISDKILIDKVLGYGLIPVGADAWLAKNQMPNEGTIILIHGNGNEEAGVEKFVEYLKNNKNISFGSLEAGLSGK
jgi:hypothetical protein